MEFEDLQRRAMAIEEETTKLRDLHVQIDMEMSNNGSSHAGGQMMSGGNGVGNTISGSANGGSSSHIADPQALAAEKEEADRRSVHVGNVDYEIDAEQLRVQFLPCGAIKRVTILSDRFTGQPKGFAYVEFSDPASVASAVMMTDTVINGRAIKVTPKRTNIPGLSRGGARGGRGMRGMRAGYKVASAYYQPPMQYGAPAYATDPNVAYALAAAPGAGGLAQYSAPYRGVTAYRGAVRGGRVAYPNPGFHRGSSVRGGYSGYTPY